MSGPDRANSTYDFFMESQFWPGAALRSFQQDQLGQLLRHAQAHVPFYAGRLGCVAKPDGDFDWSRWLEIPILTRQEAVAHFGEMQARQLPPGHGPVQENSTSGSTGLPLTVRFPQVLSDVCKAADWRAHRWWDLDWSKTHVHWHKYNAAQEAYGAYRSYKSWGPDGSGIPSRAFVANASWPTPQLIQHLQDTGAAYVSVQGSTIYAVALEMQRLGMHHALDAVCVHGTGFDDTYAKAVAAAFDAPLHAIYSSKEGGRLAHTCASCGQYHVNAESVLLEILRDDGTPCTAGETGRVIITPFFNTAQPFIRYEQGDLASWSASGQCKVTLPSLTGISGRQYHLFRRPDGTPFMPTLPDHDRALLGARFWQFAQVSLDEIEVRYASVGPSSPEREQAFAAHLCSCFAAPFKVSFRQIEQVPLTPAGKFLKYANEIPAP